MVKKNNQTEEIKFNVYVKDVKPITGKDNSYRFTCLVNGVTIYGMKSIAYIDKDTKEQKSFIAFPSYKGNNDKFYNNAWFPIDEKLQETIEEKISYYIRENDLPF